VTQVAVSYGLNANLVHKWRRLLPTTERLAARPPSSPCRWSRRSRHLSRRSPLNWSCSAVLSTSACAGR